MKYKALICDIDGTLVVNDKEALPTPRIKNAVRDATKRVSVSIATGRPLQFTDKIFASLTLNGPCILANGAMIYDPVKKETVREHPLSPADVVDILPLVEELGIEAFCRDVDSRYQVKKGIKPVRPLYIYFPPMAPELLAKIEDYASRDRDLIVQKMITWGKEGTDYMMTKSTATKQHAVLEVAQILGIGTHEIIGVGDGYNDFPLLMACGLRVAMGNAVPDIKAIADYVAPTVYEDGVADVIEKFILNPQ